MEIEENNIYCGDSYKLIKDIPDKSIDLIITDPPYQIDGLHTGTGILKDRSKNLSHYINQMLDTDLGKGIDLSILDDFVRIMKKINIYIWCNKEQIYDYLTYFVKEKGCNWEIIIWSKSNVPPFTNGHFLKDKEYCLYFWEQGIKIKGNYDTLKTVYIGKVNHIDKEDYTHPTIKPIEIIKNLIENSSERGGVIFDAFLGSGTTCVASKMLDRKYIGFEINEKYYEIAKDRLNGINQKGEMSLFDTDFDKVQKEYEQMNLFED